MNYNYEVAFNTLKNESLSFCDIWLEKSKDNENIVIDKETFKRWQHYIKSQGLFDDSISNNSSNSG